jgi:hypothetical protein
VSGAISAPLRRVCVQGLPEDHRRFVRRRKEIAEQGKKDRPRPEQDLRGDFGPGLARAFRWVKPFLRRAVERRFSRALVLASIMEDLPRRANRVTPIPGSGRLSLHYQLQPHDRARIALWRRKLTQDLRPYRVIVFRDRAS